MEARIHFFKESRIFNYVGNDDVEGLNFLLMHYPNLFQIGDDFDCTIILQKAISMSRKKVFDFLLSLNDCPINARNRRGETALDVALSLPPERNFYHHVFGRITIDYDSEDFAISLIEKGADFNNYTPGKGSVLHRALRANLPRLAKLLIERGANLNCQDENGETPLHLVHKLEKPFNSSVRNELLDTMLYLGADPSIPNNEGYTLIEEFVFTYNFLSESMQEHLLFYCFDDYCTDYEIPVDTLFELPRQDLRIAPQMLKYATSVNLKKNNFGSLDCFFNDLLVILKPEYLKLLLEKFDYVIESTIDATLDYGWKYYYVKWEKIGNFENFHLLFQSQFSADIIEIINKTEIHKVINHVYKKIERKSLLSRTETLDFIFILLSYGANIYDQDMEYMYETFGDCEFFRTLLHMDIKVRNKNRQCDIMPALLYNVDMDIETFLNAPHNYSLNSLREVLNYFAHPKLKNFCCSLPIQDEDVHAKVKKLPSVPLLVELARNETRKFLIKKYKIKNSMQFCTLIKQLSIGEIYEKIITFETRLY